ncbi:MAG: hypothetical protein NZ888_00785 [Candidatus Nitrosocaldus sp.]|nr:hypothetical protein [Candidatus Nitrosocaldus sp.]
MNGSMVKQESSSKGKGMAEKLEFKNPVTFELIDKNGNVVSKTVAYNAITSDGQSYIYEVLGNPAATIAALDTMSFSSTTALALDTNNDSDPDDTGPTLSSDSVTCTPSSSATEAECVATFTFAADYTPSADGELILDDMQSMSVGNGNTVYFTIVEGDANEPEIPVDDAVAYASLKITWTITVS